MNVYILAGEILTTPHMSFTSSIYTKMIIVNEICLTLTDGTLKLGFIIVQQQPVQSDMTMSNYDIKTTSNTFSDIYC